MPRWIEKSHMISRMRFWLTLFTISLFTISGALAQDAGATRADWPHYGGTQFSWRYSALDQINTSNVKALTPVWLFQTGDYAENLQTTPIVENGVMYLITARARVFALDAATGREIWKYAYPEPPRSVPGFVGNRGLAIGDGKVFFGTKNNDMVALDQKTGRLLWRVNIDDARQCGCNITAAPLVVKDKVIVGGTGGDGAHRGALVSRCPAPDTVLHGLQGVGQAVQVDLAAAADGLSGANLLQCATCRCDGEEKLGVRAVAGTVRHPVTGTPAHPAGQGDWPLAVRCRDR